jgi:uncharacterized membrane protein
MKNNCEWRKRRIRYIVNNNFIGKIFVRLYYLFEELIWLGICVGILVVILYIMLVMGLRF